MFRWRILEGACFCVKMAVMHIVFMRSVELEMDLLKETEETEKGNSGDVSGAGRSCRPAGTCQLTVMTSTKCKLEASLDGLGDNLTWKILWYVYYIKSMFRGFVSSSSFFPSTSLRPSTIFYSLHYHGLADATSTRVRLDCLLHDRSHCSPL